MIKYYLDHCPQGVGEDNIYEADTDSIYSRGTVLSLLMLLDFGKGAAV
ncbi:MAG: hypothetical protein ACLUFM_02495 [Lachnospiraceae bacterium]